MFLEKLTTLLINYNVKLLSVLWFRVKRFAKLPKCDLRNARIWLYLCETTFWKLFFKCFKRSEGPRKELVFLAFIIKVCHDIFNR